MLSTLFFKNCVTSVVSYTEEQCTSGCMKEIDSTESGLDNVKREPVYVPIKENDD